MTQTVRDLMIHHGGRTEYPRAKQAMEEVNTAGLAQSERERPRLFTVRLIMNPEDCQLIDGMVVFEKRLISHDRQAAALAAGLDVRGE